MPSMNIWESGYFSTPKKSSDLRWRSNLSFARSLADTLVRSKVNTECGSLGANVTCFPFFVNEAAYYEKGIAMMIGHRNEQPVNVLVSVESGEQIVKRQKRS